MEILGYTDASRAGIILLLIPIVSTIIAVAFLGEALPPAVLLGGVLVLVGVIIVEHTRPEVQSAHRAPGSAERK